MEQRVSPEPVGNPAARTRNYFIVICVLFSLGVGLSLHHDIRQARKDRYQLAASTGRVLFHTIVAARSWNAHHGGVYVPVTETTRPTRT